MTEISFSGDLYLLYKKDIVLMPSVSDNRREKKLYHDTCIVSFKTGPACINLCFPT